MEFKPASAVQRMRVLLFGATGMVGQGVLRQCLLAQDVEEVVTLGRSVLPNPAPKLQQIVHGDLFDYHGMEAQLRAVDACFFCLGVSSAGMSEAAYSHLTYDLTLAAATALAACSPQCIFVYVSGAGTDSSERGRIMWARVKGRTENALRRLPFRAVYLFRPGVIQPLHGVVSKTPAYRRLYTLAAPLLTLLRRLAPDRVLTTEGLGEAMLRVARAGPTEPVLEAADIRRLAA